MGRAGGQDGWNIQVNVNPTKARDLLGHTLINGIAQVIKTFCDGFSRPMEKYDFVSTGNALVVNFLSMTGSYSGSSLQYWAQYDFFDASTGEFLGSSLFN